LFAGVRNRLKQECFQLATKVLVDRSSFSSFGSLFHARGAETEKALYDEVAYCAVRYEMLL